MNLSEPPHSASVFRDGAGRGCLRSGGSQVVMAGKSTRGDGGTSRARRLVFPTVAQARQTSGVNVDRRCFLAFGPMLVCFLVSSKRLPRFSMAGRRGEKKGGDLVSA